MNNYFPHDSNARNSDKLLPVRMKYGAEGYGIYFMLLERLREEADYTSIKDYNMLAFDLRVDAGKLKSIIEDFGLFAFTDDGECFYSDSFKKRMEIKDAKSKKLSEAGRQGAEKRWNKSNQEAKPKGSHSHPIANAKENDSKERKEKESKGNKRKENKIKEPVFPLSKPSTPTRHKYGEYKNVLLSDEEMERLQKEFPNDWQQRIERVSEYCASQGKSYKNYLATIRNWAKREKQQPKPTGYPRQPIRQEQLPDWVSNPAEEKKLSPDEQAKLEEELQKLMNGA